eukprot:2151162-Pleurochrysis_carterae.AAC.1
MSEPAGALICVKGVGRSGRSASAAVIRRAFVFRARDSRLSRLCIRRWRARARPERRALPG